MLLLTAIFALMVCASTCADEVPRGFRPHPRPLRHLTNSAEHTYSKRFLRAGPLPARYDLRDVDGAGTSYLSPVRNQNPYGTCWVFATMAGIEYQIRKDESLNADLSENNLANMHGFASGFDDGGQYYMAAAVLLREEAPVTEALDPYFAVGRSVRERGVRIPRKVVFVPARTSVENEDEHLADLEMIKRAVIAYGPLPTSYYHGSGFLNGASYYCHRSDKVDNHAVAIVGWDDDYPASRFKTTPPGDGAFIIRNSWGTTSGENGYLYVSYYDRVLGFSGEVVFTRLSNGDDYGHIYQYDRYGYVDSYGYGSESAFAANVYTARANETLTAFGFYAFAEGTAYTAYIILNPTLTDTSISGEQIMVASGICAEAGYEVLDFSRTVDVSAGCTFAIVVLVTTPGFDYPIVCTRNDSGYVAGVEARPHLSYARGVSDLEWEDFSSEAVYFCCKVYAAPVAPGSTTSTAAPISKAWLEAYSAQASLPNCLSNLFYGAYNALAEHVAANKLTVADSFLRGLDPDNAAYTNLLATISFNALGFPVIDATPKNSAIWTYSVLGSQDLVDWHARTDADRFFKVSVSPR